jgi:hypothetical protein
MAMKLLIRAVLILAILQLPGLAMANDDLELAEKMSRLQYFMHKSALALDRKNQPLADFYAHELAVSIEDTMTIESHNDYPVGELTKTMLQPVFKQYEAALNSGNWNKIPDRFDAVINSCNGCHEATAHGFIEIQRLTTNPFMQSFESPITPTSSN